MDFPIAVSGQLRQQLRALRRMRGWTQAELGKMLGVGQARIAEIEANPGSVSVEQLLRLLAVLQTRMVLQTHEHASATSGADRVYGRSATVTQGAARQKGKVGEAEPAIKIERRQGSW
ncbi:Antitoxin HipB [Pigmentiphaga humi]|uniref:Antitoxin HipB n=1 Tax=Pigmentiphaga humi TaxID=2478468 RepID=A0A3P4B679_9BURK|nr:helix-turn-helix domain-containing protein [Pigmentiphaga humi]VCU71814.1 Antitoxin HipB [Pigmentiphaga humi]